jgi:hypothetical protein
MAGKAFGGYELNFKGQDASMEEVMGDQPLAPSEMTSKIWEWIRKHKLSNKK